MEKDRALAAKMADHDNPGASRNGWHPMGNELDRAARVLRRAQMTLHRWAEEMCNGTIQREGEQADGKPFRVVEYGARFGLVNKFAKIPAPDREAGALRRVAKACKVIGFHFYHQTDPRGCALYVAKHPLNHDNYNTGVACIA